MTDIANSRDAIHLKTKNEIIIKCRNLATNFCDDIFHFQSLDFLNERHHQSNFSAANKQAVKELSTLENFTIMVTKP